MSLDSLKYTPARLSSGILAEEFLPGKGGAKEYTENECLGLNGHCLQEASQCGLCMEIGSCDVKGDTQVLSLVNKSYIRVWIQVCIRGYGYIWLCGILSSNEHA